jgi:hypothetical protein
MATPRESASCKNIRGIPNAPFRSMISFTAFIFIMSVFLASIAFAIDQEATESGTGNSASS